MNPEDLAATDRLITPPRPTDRIYGWLDTQMSIARHYGGLTYQGESYVIDENTRGQPLVRLSLLAAEGVSKRLAAKTEKAAMKESMKKKQGELL